MKVALVHDWLNQMGGAENVLEVFVDMFPHAPIYTSIFDPKRVSPTYREWDIRVSWMNKLPGVGKHHQLYLPFYPLAFESFDLSGYDLVISNKSAFAHSVITPPETVHISYCLTPTRFLWQYASYRRREGIGRVANALLQPILTWQRQFDRLAADRVDHFVAISREVQARIRKFYRRESVIIHPPVDTRRFRPASRPPGDYFLVVSRLIPYKRVDLAVEACTRLHLPLIVVGDGRDRKALERMAGPTVTFLGRVSQEELVELMQGARAFLFPGVEDFGIAPVEAMACGRPVIAYAGGGALDTVVPGVTGEFFHEQRVESLMDVLRDFDPFRYDPLACRAQAEKFDTTVFRQKFLAFVEEVMDASR
ncbi:MAG: glycosyltransferase family 4 protein [Chloroflexi bacterium]|nr:glycosyltransferase family 4 protein [Chloroflexota bacterium]